MKDFCGGCKLCSMDGKCIKKTVCNVIANAISPKLIRNIENTHCYKSR